MSDDDDLRELIQRRLRQITSTESRPPDLDRAEVRFERHLEGDFWVVRCRLRFESGPDFSWVDHLPHNWGRYPFQPHPAYCASIEAYIFEVWSRIAEDRAIQEQTRRQRETYEEAERLGAPPDMLEYLHRQLHEAERHARRYHGARHDYVFYDEATFFASDGVAGPIPLPEPRPLSAEDFRRARDILNSANPWDQFSLTPIEMTATEVRWMRERELGQRMRRAERAMRGLVLGLDLASASLGITPEAEERGMKLLKEHLTPKQLKQYEDHNFFDVKGGVTGTTYRIHHGRQMNIHALNRFGNKKFGLCFLPAGNLCHGDTMLAQKLTLELQEDEALRIGNRF